MINRQWLLASRPEGSIEDTNFSYKECEVPNRELKPNEILVKNLLFLCAPTMRNWMSPPGNSLYPSIPLGSPIMAPAIAVVIESGSAEYAPGDRVSTRAGWQDYEILSTDLVPVGKIPDEMTSVDAMGKFGLNSLTGYFGMLEVGQPKENDVVVVSGAAGATGSVAAQIARIIGCRVIGIAGGDQKCRWLTEECQLDAAVNYKNATVEEELRQLCPDGINVYYDNVGGDILQAAIENMAVKSRIVLCGQISSYNDDKPSEGPRNMMRLIYGSITMQGFLTRNYTDNFPSAISNLKTWYEQGKVLFKEDVREGFENLPLFYRALFDGSNDGVLLVQINSD